MSRMSLSSTLPVTWTCCVASRACRPGRTNGIHYTSLSCQAITLHSHWFLSCACSRLNLCMATSALLCFSLHLWLWVFARAPLSICVCPCMFRLLSQAGHDCRPTEPEQPNQDLFLPIPACLLQPGQKELRPGVRIPPDTHTHTQPDLLLTLWYWPLLLVIAFRTAFLTELCTSHC